MSFGSRRVLRPYWCGSSGERPYRAADAAVQLNPFDVRIREPGQLLQHLGCVLAEDRRWAAVRGVDAGEAERPLLLHILAGDVSRHRLPEPDALQPLVLG